MSIGSEFFDTPSDLTDGYLRVNTRTSRISKAVHPESGRGLVFVDIEGVPDPDIVIHALHQEPLFTCETIVFRWPKLGARSKKALQQVSQFLQHSPLRSFLADCGVSYFGVMRFAIGEAPTIVWRQNYAPTVSGGESRLIDRALRCEIRALLEYGHAIWRPRNYHYELPSGDHTDSFIRIADAFRTPRDVEVVATWFLHCLSDNVAVILDTASLIPLACEFRRLLAEEGASVAGTETLDAYPATSLEIQQAIQSIGDHDALLAIMSVNASGRFKSRLFEAIQHSESPNLVVLVDKQNAGAARGHLGTTVSGVQLSSWVSIGQQHGNLGLVAGKCSLCLQNDLAQTVRIDARSFNAFALPQDNLLMPDVAAARAARRFFDLCDEHGAIELNSFSAEYIREKQPPMGVKMRLDRLAAEGSFHDLVLGGIEKLPLSEQLPFDHIVVSKRDMEIPGFSILVDKIKQRYATNSATISAVSLSSDSTDIDTAGQVAASARPLIFSLGSVSGWLLRRLQLYVQNQWHGVGSAGKATAIVVHARPTSARKWDNLVQSFEKRLHALWLVNLPDSAPHADEFQLLEQSNVQARVDEANYQNQEALQRFYQERLELCSGTGDAITTTNVLWFPTPQSRLRNTSVYGTRINAVTTFAAVASAIQRRRQEAQFTDPRWPVFDFVSMGRSYFDGLIIACMLRWCTPSEVWWGKDPEQRQANIEWLVRNTRDRDDQGILYAELIIAAAQGKIPDFAVVPMCELIAEKHAEWDDAFRIPILAALILLSGQYSDLVSLVGDIDVNPSQG